MMDHGGGPNMSKLNFCYETTFITKLLSIDLLTSIDQQVNNPHLSRNGYTGQAESLAPLPCWLHHSVQCSAVQCSAVQCSAVQCSANYVLLVVPATGRILTSSVCLLLRPVTRPLGQGGEIVQCSAVQCSAVQCRDQAPGP
jgi:hypothetical protein